MNNLYNMTPPMQSIFWARENKFIKQALLVLAGVIVLALASQLSIPLRPIPLTFQSVTVVLIGMAYGARYGALVVMAYMMAGVLGLPVFADASSGTSVFYGPTVGYLVGFLPAAYVSGYLAEKGWAKNIFTSFLAATLGVSIIFACGVSALAHSIGWHNAIVFGLAPFVLSELAKLAAAACVIPRCWKKS